MMQGLKNCLDPTGYINTNSINSIANTSERKSGTRFRQILESSLSTSITTSDKCRNTRAGIESAGKSEIATDLKVIRQLHTRNSELNRLLEQVVNGTRMETGEMLALQGLILNFTRDITAVSKVVESLMTGLKTILQTQV
jgi:hypothetical protein